MKQLLEQSASYGERFNNSILMVQVQDKQIMAVDQLKGLAEQMGTDGWVADADYFITMNNGYPWADIPKVLIGRSGYDNWLVKIRFLLKAVPAGKQPYPSRKPTDRTTHFLHFSSILYYCQLGKRHHEVFILVLDAVAIKGYLLDVAII